MARGFEPFLIVTDSGHTYSGVLGRDTADAIYLRTSDQAEIQIAHNAIDEMVPSQVSVMPEGLDRTMTHDELGDLLAFLSSLRAGNGGR